MGQVFKELSMAKENCDIWQYSGCSIKAHSCLLHKEQAHHNSHIVAYLQHSFKLHLMAHHAISSASGRPRLPVLAAILDLFLPVKQTTTQLKYFLSYHTDHSPFYHNNKGRAKHLPSAVIQNYIWATTTSGQQFSELLHSPPLHQSERQDCTSKHSPKAHKRHTQTITSQLNNNLLLFCHSYHSATSVIQSTHIMYSTSIINWVLWNHKAASTIGAKVEFCQEKVLSGV